MKLKIKIKKNAGFTLIELLVSFAILSMGISVSINLISKSLQSSSYLRNQTIASYLAVEGIELIKNKRDENFLKGNDWIEDIENNCKSVKGCYLDSITDPLNITINKCTGSKCPSFLYNTAKNTYNYSTGVNTIFTRTVKLLDVLGANGNDEKEIMSEIKWKDKFGDHIYTLKTSIFNWK